MRLSFFIIFFFCCSQIAACHTRDIQTNKNDSLTNTDSSAITKVSAKIYEVDFDKLDSTVISFDQEEIKLCLTSSTMQLAMPYEILVALYGNHKELTLELHKLDSAHYCLDLIQVPYHAIVDRLYFRSVNGLLEMYKIEQEQYGNYNQICLYKMPSGYVINISELNEIGCFETNHLVTQSGEMIPVLKHNGILDSFPVDSIQISEELFECEIGYTCAVGHFLFDDEKKMNKIPSVEIRHLVYGQYKKSDTELIALFFYDQYGNGYCWNLHNQAAVERICNTYKNRTAIIAKLIVFKVYTPLYNYNLVEVADIMEK